MVKTQRERRGGMPAKGNPGDKNFHHVENSPGFHQAGELSVGSSFYRSVPYVIQAAFVREGGDAVVPFRQLWPPLSTQRVAAVILFFCTWAHDIV